MAFILEGYLRQNSRGSGLISIKELTGTVTSFSGDYTGIDLKIFLKSQIFTFYLNEAILVYTAESQTWETRTFTTDSAGVPLELFLVKAGDFPDGVYTRDALLAKALALTTCTPATNVNVFWGDWTSLIETLSTPTGLYADNITSNSARTNWQAVENASNYKVQYKAAGDTVWTETYTD